MITSERLRRIPDWFGVSGVRAAILAGSFAASFAAFALVDSPSRMFCLAVGAIAFAALLIYPEFALALYLVIGDVKGDDRVSSLFPVDLTLALAALLIAGI